VCADIVFFTNISYISVLVVICQEWYPVCKKSRISSPQRFVGTQTWPNLEISPDKWAD